MNDVQRELDTLAATLGHSVSLDGPDGTLIAYSTQGADVDPVRVEAILTRRVPAAVLAYQRRHGIDTATAPVRVPANPDLDMTARLCLPIRRGRRLVAYLWVLDAALDGPALRSLTAAGARLEALLPRSPDIGSLLTDSPEVLDLPRTRTLQFVAIVASEADPPRDVVASALVHGRLLTLLGPPREVRVPGVVGHSAPFRLADTDLAGVARRAAQACVAADCAAVDPALGSAVGWDGLGVYRRLILTTDPATWPDPLPVPDDDRSAPMLRHTLETYLDLAGDAARAIATLGIHRTTFYYRLDRLTTRYGIRLDDGLVRTELHLALKTRRLAEARDRFAWTDGLLARLS